MKPKLDISQKNEILDAYLKDKSCDRVAKKFGVSIMTMWAFIKKHSNMCRRKKLSEPQIDLLVEDYHGGVGCKLLGRKYGISESIARDYLMDRKIERKKLNFYRKHKINKDFFREGLNKKLLWVLGWLFSDGNVSKDLYEFNITTHKNDKEVLLKLEKLLDAENLVTTCRNKNTYRLRVNSGDMCRDLVELGCVPAKSLIIKYPTFLKTKEQHFAFIKGVFEGDGHIGQRRDKSGFIVEISSGSLDFLIGMQEFLKNDCYIDTKIDHSKVSKCHKLRILGGIKEVCRFMDCLYADSLPEHRMERKYNVYLKIKEACKNKGWGESDIKLISYFLFRLKYDKKNQESAQIVEKQPISS